MAVVHRSKRFFLASLVLLLVLLIGTAVQAQEQITLRVSWWGSETRHQRTIQVIELFQEQYPHITIEADPYSVFDDYWIAMNGQGQAGNLPDVIQQDYSRIAGWVDAGWLLPLDDLVADGIIDLSDVSEANVEGGRVGEDLYAISLGTNSFGIVIDLDDFEAAGVELPPQDWTWDDFEQICMELYERLDKWCIGGNLGNENHWVSLWLGYGLLPYAEGGTALGYEDDQPLVDYLNMLLRLQSAGAMPNRAQQIMIEGTAEDEPIILGQSAMANMWSNQLVAVWNAAGEERRFVMYHLPRPVDGCCPANYVKPSQFFSINAATEHPEEAAMLIDFFTNSLEANRILLAERGVPISSVVQADLADYVSPAQAETFEFMSRVEADSSPLPPPDPAVHATIRDTLINPILRDAIMFEEITPEEGVALFREEASAILAGGS